MLHFMTIFALLGVCIIVAPTVFRFAWAVLLLTSPIWVPILILAMFAIGVPVVITILNAILPAYTIPPLIVEWFWILFATFLFCFGLFGTGVLVKDLWRHEFGPRKHAKLRQEPHL